MLRSVGCSRREQEERRRITIPARSPTVVHNHTTDNPHHQAWNEFAGDLGFEYADDPAGELLTKGASTYAQQLAPLLRFHASKSVLPSSALKDGSTVTTLLPGGSFKVARDEGGDDGGDAAIELLVPLVDLATKAVDTESTDALSATDLTFERGAAYKGGGRYVVHAVERVLVPPALADSLRGVTAAVAKSRPQSGSSGSGSGSSGSSSGSGSKPAAAAPAPSPPSRG